MEENTTQQPTSALSSPRFCNTGTFMRMPRLESFDELDFASGSL